MNIIGIFLGLVVGVTLTILTEIIKKATQKKIVASKLHADSILTLKEIMESDLVPFVAAASKIYSDNDIFSSREKLNTHLEEMKTKMKADPDKIPSWILEMKADKIKIQKHLHISTITEDKYKNGTLLLNREELSILPPHIQTIITEKIENQFYSAVSFRFFIDQVNNVPFDKDRCIEHFSDVTKYIIKTYKDRESIFKYAQNTSKRSLFRSVLLELNPKNF